MTTTIGTTNFHIHNKTLHVSTHQGHNQARTEHIKRIQFALPKMRSHSFTTYISYSYGTLKSIH